MIKQKYLFCSRNIARNTLIFLHNLKHIKWIVPIILILCLSMNSAVPTQASEKLTSAEFLRWSEDSRSSYVKIAGAMAGMIAVNNGQSAQRDCINRWYSGDQKQSNAYIADVMTDYPEAHPLAVLFAILENKCGSFDYRNQ